MSQGFVDPYERRLRDLEMQQQRLKAEQTWIREQFLKLKQDVDGAVRVIPHEGFVK